MAVYGFCSMPNASELDDAYGTSAHHMLLSNCVGQVMRVWSLPALLLLLAKHGYTLPADSVPHIARNLRRPLHTIPCAYIWVPFQLRRSLVALGLDLPVLSVHGAGAYDATASPACNQTQHHTFYGCSRLGSAAYPL
jgi:hypothetical protein